MKLLLQIRSLLSSSNHLWLYCLNIGIIVVTLAVHHLNVNVDGLGFEYNNKSVFSSVDSFLLELAHRQSDNVLNEPKVTLIRYAEHDNRRYGDFGDNEALFENLINYVSAMRPSCIGLIGHQSLSISPAGNNKTKLIGSYNYFLKSRVEKSYAVNKAIRSVAINANSFDSRPQFIDATHIDTAVDIVAPKDLAHFTDLGFLHQGLATSDNKVEFYPLIGRIGNSYYKSFAVALLEAARDTPLSLVVSNSGAPLLRAQINGRPKYSNKDSSIILRYFGMENESQLSSFPQYGFAEVLDGKSDPEHFINKVVIVEVLEGSRNHMYVNPSNNLLTSRGEIEAVALQNLMDDSMIGHNSLVNYIEILLIFVSVVSCIYICRRLSPALAIGVSLLIVPLIGISLQQVLYEYYGQWLLVSYAGASFFFAFVANFTSRYFIDDKQRRLVTRALSGYTSKTVVERIISDGSDFLNSSGSTQNLSILVYDICQFTTLSLKLGPERSFRLLNEIFSITDAIIIDKYNGMIDKKMGDAAIAIFGLSGTTQEAHAVSATNAAIEIQEAMFDNFGRLQEVAGGQLMAGSPIQLRIGISTGNVFLGNVGSKEHINFTAIGDVVNLAQRIEMNCPAGRIMVSEGSYGCLLSDSLADQVCTERRVIPGKYEGEEYIAYLVSTRPR